MKLFSVQECSFRKRAWPLRESEELLGSQVILVGTSGLSKQSGYVSCPICKYIVRVPETPRRLFLGGMLERSLPLEG